MKSCCNWFLRVVKFQMVYNMLSYVALASRLNWPSSAIFYIVTSELSKEINLRHCRFFFKLFFIVHLKKKVNSIITISNR